MVDFTDILQGFFSDYAKRGVPIDVDFRKIVPIANLDRLTHFIHPYPAKLLQNIPIFFLNSLLATSQENLIFDPFSGSGTVALESLISNNKSLSIDLNPFACLLTRVKCTYIEEEIIQDQLMVVLKKAKSKRPVDFNVVNKDIWFLKDNYKNLSKLICSINELENEKIKDFFRVCFSQAMRKASNADPRISVPVRINVEKYPEGHRLKKYYQNVLRQINSTDVYDIFKSVVNQNKKRIAQIKSLENKIPQVFEKDARLMPEEAYEGKVDLIITSPPYPGAQKYIRACSLSLGWLELFEGELIELKRQIIGREEVRQAEYTGNSGSQDADKLIGKIYKSNKNRATIAESYLRDMRLVLQSCFAYLKPGGYLVLIAANNLFCHEEFLTLNYLRELASNEKFECQLELVDTIKSYGLMTKRNKSAGLISREGIMLLKKIG